jgi:hypothetical protein
MIWISLGVVAIVLLAALLVSWRVVIYTPGPRFSGPLSPLEAPQAAMAKQLKSDVQRLSVEIGERNLGHYAALNEAADFLEAEFVAAGYSTSRQEYDVNGLACYNIEAQLAGALHPEEIILVGAHYDSVFGAPGANDNASGAAAVLALARAFKGRKTDRTLRFVAFTNEEPPYFQTPDMGSWVYARRCRERDDDLRAVLILETIGYYRDEPGTQAYPPPFSAFYPDTGNFIAVVGNVGSRPLVHRVIGSFRRQGRFPAEGGAALSGIPGIGWSDHWSFWQEGYQAVMITDTAPFRYPYYHTIEDTPDKLNFEHMARVVAGVEGVVREFAGGSE